MEVLSKLFYLSIIALCIFSIITLADDITYGNLWVQKNVSVGGMLIVQGDSILSGNLDMSGNELTDIGELIMSGLITSESIIPDTTELYTLGNSTHWWDEAYIKTLYSEDIYTNMLNATEINSTDVNSDNVDVEKNLTIGGYKLREDEAGDMVVILG